jgi:hypothetical protein
MRGFGHERVDLLKLDIEGAEYDVLADLLSSTIRIGQLLVEFHHLKSKPAQAATRKAVAALNAAGYLITAISDLGVESSFLYVGDRTGGF